MIEKLQIYKCNVCGNIVEVLFAGGGTLVCCGENMHLLAEQFQEQGNEKHVPIVEKAGHGIKVKVGSVPHPMEESHSIQWIEVQTKEKAYREFLQPGSAPEAKFDINVTDVLKARELCNLHGLWKSK